MILKKGKTNNKMIRNDKLIHVRKQHKKCLKQFPLLHKE